MVYGQLHQLIDQNKWDDILLNLREDQALQSDAKELHRDDLPLHMACEKKAPDDVVLEILRHNTDAVFHQGRGGSFPLHVAAQRNLGANVIESLIRLNPSALDVKNVANYSPRDFGHGETYAYQALNRPTCCWVQLMRDEKREEEHDKRLSSLHEKISKALNSLTKSSAEVGNMTTRLDHVEKKLRDFEDLKAIDLEATIKTLEQNIRDTMNNIEDRLSTVEDDVKAAAARDYIARAASRAHQSDVVKMQRVIGEEARMLKTEVDSLKVEMSVQKVLNQPV